MDELVSVIIPTYKGQDTLARAIKSVTRQTYSNIEIIVIDDNDPVSDSRKETEAVIKSLEINNLIYIKHEKNKNGAVARNTGVAKARGKYICFLDDDDVYLTTRIEKSVAALRKHPECGIVLCDVVHVGDKWMGTIYKMDETDLTPKGIMLNGAALGTGSNLFLKSSIIKSVGGFDSNFLRHQDLEFGIRVLSVTKPMIVHEILVVKCFDGNDNQPNYSKLVQVKEQFNSKFCSIINAMDYEEQRCYYYACYMLLYGTALETGTIEDIKDCVSNLQNYGFDFNLKRKVQCFLAIVGISHTSLYKKIRNLKENTDSGKIDVRTISHKLNIELEVAFI